MSTTPGQSTRPRRRLQPRKREAITSAARVVFGRDGYSRASIDAIASEAGVSTRTIYNHFAGKQQLFSSVLEESATQVADAVIANIDRAMTGAGLEADLVGLGRALATQRTDFPEHFAMVRQINAEAAHFPPAILEAWQQAGPIRVRHEVARRLYDLARRDLLRIADPPRAAYHFLAMTSIELSAVTLRSTIGVSEDETLEIIAAAVRAFLNGYAA